jgi:predicted XRE-type DNA-binding protein
MGAREVQRKIQFLKKVNKMIKKKQNPIEEIECEISSGNVFADLGIENPEEELTKAKLVWEIELIIKKRKLSQAEAAKVMGINQPKVSALIRRKLDGFSVERLIHFLNALGQDIDIVVRPKPRNRKQAVINVYHENGLGRLAVPMAAKGI